MGIWTRCFYSYSKKVSRSGLGVVNLHSYKAEKKYQEFYKAQQDTPHLQNAKMRSVDLLKQYTAAWIKLLSSNISNKEGL